MCYDRTSVAVLEQQEREAKRQQYACFETDQEGPTDTEEYGITLVSANLPLKVWEKVVGTSHVDHSRELTVSKCYRELARGDGCF